VLHFKWTFCGLQEVLDGAQVMCCTLSGALHPQLAGQVFDVVVIDEAAQAVEPACWSALLKGRKAILAGMWVYDTQLTAGGVIPVKLVWFGLVQLSWVQQSI
jgi:hypothetical protein